MRCRNAPSLAPAFGLILALIALIALAPGPPAAGEEPKQEEPKKEEAARPAPERAHPRATMKTFLTAIAAAAKDRSRLPEAVACLDLSAYDPATRRDQGPLLAAQLLEVLDRTWKVAYEQLPDAPQGDTWTRALKVEDKTVATLVMAKQPNGEWLFASEFLAGLPALLSRLEAQGYLEGLGGAGAIDPALWLRGRMPESLRKIGFLLEHWQWLGLLALVLLGVIVDRLFGWLISYLILAWLKRLKIELDERDFSHMNRPFGLAAMAAVWWFGLYWLALPPAIYAWLVKIATFFLAFAGVWAAYRLVDVLALYLAKLAERTDNKMDDLIVPLVRKTLKIFVVVVGVVFVADNLGFQITAILGALGLGGLAVALASKDTIENVFGSVTVLLDKPFQIGDWVKIGDLEGTVEEVGFRSTRIRTFYNSLVTVPNSKLVNASVDNYGMRKKRRIKCYVSVTYDTPPEKIEAFCEGIRELLRRHPVTTKDFFLVNFNQFAAASLDILLYFFVSTNDWKVELRSREEIFLDIIRLAGKLKVEFAFPTQTLHIASHAAQKPLPGAPDDAIHRAVGRRDLDDAIRIGREEAVALSSKYGGGNEKDGQRAPDADGEHRGEAAEG